MNYHYLGLSITNRNSSNNKKKKSSFTHAAIFYCIHQLDFMHNITIFAIIYLHHFHNTYINKVYKCEHIMQPTKKYPSDHQF